jgi:hypothetical protein
MGRTGSALDNAVVESFHSTIEFEVLSRTRFATREQARRTIAAWLGEYDTVRLHSTNGMIAPVDYENGRRRPGAKSYQQLRRRRSDRAAAKTKSQAEAATPPETLSEPLRDPHRRRAASGPGQATPTAGHGLPQRSRGATRPRSLNTKIMSTGPSTG